MRIYPGEYMDANTLIKTHTFCVTTTGLWGYLRVFKKEQAASRKGITNAG